MQRSQVAARSPDPHHTERSVTLRALLHERVNEPPHVIRMLVETMKTCGQPRAFTSHGRNRRSDGTQQYGEPVRVWSALESHYLIGQVRDQLGQRLTRPRQSAIRETASSSRYRAQCAGTSGSKTGLTRPVTAQIAGGTIKEQRISVQAVVDQLTDPGGQQVGVQPLLVP